MLNLFNMSDADYVLVANKPINQVGTKIECLTLLEIRERFAFEYNEDVELSINLTYNEKLDVINSTIETINQNFVRIVEERVKFSLNHSLVICKINEKVGYGIFTKEPIEAGTIIGIYAGRYVDKGTSLQTKEYGFGVNQLFAIDASISGGITRFIQHMPTHLLPIYQQIDEADLEAFYKLAFAHQLDLSSIDEFLMQELSAMKQLLKDRIAASYEDVRDENPNIQALLNSKSLIATANVMWEKFVYKGIELICLVAMRQIAKHEQLGVDYGPGYWIQKGCAPNYFDKNTGSVLQFSKWEYRTLRIQNQIQKLWLWKTGE
jgi:hypothetical protein